MRLIRVRSCVRIPHSNCFYFQTRKYFTILLQFSTSYGRLTDLKYLLRLLLVSFIWLGVKIWKIFKIFFRLNIFYPFLRRRSESEFGVRQNRTLTSSALFQQRIVGGAPATQAVNKTAKIIRFGKFPKVL